MIVMKVIFFRQSKSSKLFHIIANLSIALVVLLVGFVSFFSPAVSVAYLKNYEAIYQGNTDKNNVSLMFNVYWGTEYIEPILDVLLSHNAPATFFVGGSWLAQNNYTFDLILNANCEVGNHGYNHKDHTKLNKKQNIEEISNTHNLVKNLADTDMTLFAPPSGAYNKQTLEVASSLGYNTIMWSKDTIDWRDKNADLIYSRATKNLANGDLILMHPTEKTLAALDNIIKEIKRQGFKIVSVSENIESWKK